jgi:AraC-like DNA-binding protein
LQILAIPSGIAAVCALHPIPNQSARIRGDFFSVAVAALRASPMSFLFNTPLHRARSIAPFSLNRSRRTGLAIAMNMLLTRPATDADEAPAVAKSTVPVPGDAIAVAHERSAALADMLICVRNLHVEADVGKTHLATPNDVFSITVYGCDDLDCGQDDEPRRSGVMVSTARTENTLFRSLGRGELIAATLTVKGFLTAFGAPMQGLRDCRIPLHDIAGHRVEQELLAVVRNARSSADRVAALCGWLERRMLDEPYRGTPMERVAKAAGFMTRHSPAEAGIEQIAAALDVTRRQLERDFRHWISVAPTEYARLARAQRAAAALQSGIRAAHVAAREGFSDQAHMTRSLRDTFGVTPAALAALAKTGPDEQTRRALGGRVLMMPTSAHAVVP